MMYVGLRIKTPQKSWMKKLKTYDGNEFTSFLYNYQKKNQDTGEYEIAERYAVNVMNIVPNEDSEIIVTEIINCKPVINKSKNGQEYLVCNVSINADNVSEPKLSRYKDNVQHHEENRTFNPEENYNRAERVEEIDEEDLPF